MKIRITERYRFAFKTGFFISLFATFLFFIARKSSIINQQHFFFLVIGFFIITFAFSALILRYYIERVIYRRVKKLYDDVALIESSSFIKQPIVTDMDSLSRKVKKFATDKKIEIEMLKVRETYRREFLGNVSHELKTPLFTVQGYVETLLGGAMDDKNIRKKYLKRAEKGIERLIYIVEDLDMITKLESGSLHLETSEFDLIELIQDVFDLLEMKADKKKIKLELENSFGKQYIVRGDRDKIQQVVENLIVNSIKYGKESGLTEVRIVNWTKKQLLVRIIDNGIGIEPQHITRIFERFFRVDKSGSRAEGGSGLGLAIVKHIIEAHEQHIYVESEFGTGSEFSFTLDRVSV